jgi:hypothetical protein
MGGSPLNIVVDGTVAEAQGEARGDTVAVNDLGMSPVAMRVPSSRLLKSKTSNRSEQPLVTCFDFESQFLVVQRSVPRVWDGVSAIGHTYPYAVAA